MHGEVGGALVAQPGQLCTPRCSPSTTKKNWAQKLKIKSPAKWTKTGILFLPDISFLKAKPNNTAKSEDVRILPEPTHAFQTNSHDSETTTFLHDSLYTKQDAKDVGC